MYPGENCRSRRLNYSKNTVNIEIQVSAVHPNSTKHQRTPSKRKGSLVRTKYTRLQPVLGGLHRNYSRYRTHKVRVPQGYYVIRIHQHMLYAPIVEVSILVNFPSSKCIRT
jgi:hypothetical protein